MDVAVDSYNYLTAVKLSMSLIEKMSSDHGFYLFSSIPAILMEIVQRNPLIAQQDLLIFVLGLLCQCYCTLIEQIMVDEMEPMKATVSTM